MIEKNIEAGYLLDFYGGLLSERRKNVTDMSYNSDMSLSEIAEELGISRQAVREIIVRASAELAMYEEKLGMAEKFRTVKEKAGMAASLAREIGNEEIAMLAEGISEAIER